MNFLNEWQKRKNDIKDKIESNMKLPLQIAILGKIWVS